MFSEPVRPTCLIACGINIKQINYGKKQSREDRRLCTPEPWMRDHGRNDLWAWKGKTKPGPQSLRINPSFE